MAYSSKVYSAKVSLYTFYIHNSYKIYKNINIKIYLYKSRNIKNLSYKNVNTKFPSIKCIIHLIYIL